MARRERQALKTAVAYLRRSTDRQDQSIEDQRRTCLEHAAEHGYRIIASYTDDVSGTSTKGRNDFLRLMEDAQKPGCLFKYILAYDVSRFGRVDNDEAGYYRHLLHLSGVEVVYITENFNGDDTDDLLRPVKQWQARDESVKRSMLTIRGQVSRAEKGGWNGGRVSYGYDLEYSDSTGKPYMIVRYLPVGGSKCDKEIRSPSGKIQRIVPSSQRIPVPKGDRRRLVLGCPKRASTASRAFRMVLDGDVGFRSIASVFNSERTPAPNGGLWTPSAVRSLLTNPVYAGATVWNRKSFAKIHSVKAGKEHRLAKTERGRQRSNSPEDWIVVRDTHQALVSWEDFQLVQARLAKHREKHTGASFRSGRAKTSPYLLTGMIHCMRCGRGFQGYTTAKKKPRTDSTKIKTRYYACNGYVNISKDFCQRTLFRKEALEDGVLGFVGHRVNALLEKGGLQRIRKLLAREIRSSLPDKDAQLEPAKRELAETDRKIDGLTDSLAVADDVSRVPILDKISRLGQRKKELEALVHELQSTAHQEVDIDATVDEIMASVRGFEDLFAHGTLEEQKEFIRLWVEKIELDPDRREGKVYIKKFPLPADGNGNSSFEMVAGAGFEPATFGL